MIAKRKEHSFEDNFDVSVILPFYKKLDVFKVTLEVNKTYFERNGIEVVIVMDEPSEKAGLLDLIKKYPFINWRVLVNEEPHDWRNPAKALNVGIKAATKNYVLVMGPDSEMTCDIVYSMRRMAEYYDNSFFVGRVGFVDMDYIHSQESLYGITLLYYGSIFLRKEFLVAIHGYDESYEKWGGDDDNIRARLQRYGIQMIKMPFNVLLHREPTNELIGLRRKVKDKTASRDMKELRNSLMPGKYLPASSRHWGTDFSKVIYDYQCNVYARELCLSYARSNFKTFEAKEDAFVNEFKVIALLPVYNEKAHIREVLANLENYCDGIILLDDGSEDDTYDLAMSEKLLLKVKKERSDRFDDLYNRNCLLNLASFFKCAYYFFIDADERFDDRFAGLRELADSNASDTYCFHIVHLWDNDSAYRTNVPEQSQIGRPGILQRWRMFKNIGRMNITGDRLHFEATPYKTKKVFAPILLKHFGLLKREIREMKYQRYHTEDEMLFLNPQKYDYFLDEDAIVKTVEQIELS